MENKKGSGIFLGVVSVATLIVAIIGATFAYFSASIEGSNTVNVTAYEFNASLSVSPVYPETAASIIPLNPEGAVTGVEGKKNLSYAMNEAATRCVDSNKYQVCAVYSATFTNNGSQDITLNGTLTTTKNDPSTSKREGATGFTNLKFGYLTGTKEANNLTLAGEALAIKSNVEEYIAIEPVTITAGQSVTKYFVVYLNEAADANNAEMGAKFEGKLTYTSATGGQQLTGTFNVSGS